MIIDTSAIMAILLDEPERREFGAAIDSASAPRMSAGTRIELASVSIRRFEGRLETDLNALLENYAVAIVPVTVEQAQIGSAAYASYGIGSGHPARLNFGDCFAYALSKFAGEPLLFKGDDFTHTDVARVLV